MRGYPKALSVFACAAILMSQVAGLHLHASPNPDNMGLHAAHVHDADLDGHDHSADVDVSVVELSPLWAKLAPMLAEYYAFRGWDKLGAPSKSKLKELSLEFAIEESHD